MLPCTACKNTSPGADHAAPGDDGDIMMNAIKKMARRALLLAAGATVCTALCLPAPARAAENLSAGSSAAHVVASDQVFNSLTGMKAYCEDAGVRFVRIRDRSELAGVERFLVFGSPSGEDLAGEIIRASLSEKEMKDANTMGKGVLAEKTWEGKPVLIFATAYSINSFVKGHAEDWKDIFENWYYIARSITSIIGY